MIHELSHSFVARRRGFTVRDIVLLPIGGVSEISGLPGAPADELAIAIAGPLASVGARSDPRPGRLRVRSGASWPPTLFAGAIVSRLMWANLLLAGFNLLPAIPMDGGRVLRALLARRRSDLRATVLAVQIGRFIGLAMVLLGVRYDLWLSVIGLFVFVGAGGERRAAAVRTAVGGLKVVRRDGARSHDSRGELPALGRRAVPAGLTGPGAACGRPWTLRRPHSGRPAPRASWRRRWWPTPPIAPLRALAPDDPLYPVAVECLSARRRRAAAVLEDGRVVGVLYCAAPRGGAASSDRPDSAPLSPDAETGLRPSGSGPRSRCTAAARR